MISCRRNAIVVETCTEVGSAQRPQVPDGDSYEGRLGLAQVTGCGVSTPEPDDNSSRATNRKKRGALKKTAGALAVLLGLLVSACSGSNPSAPTPPAPQPQPITVTVHLTETGSGQPLAGVAGTLGSASGVTNGDGGVQFQLAPGAAQRLSLTGASIVPRSVMLAVNGSREVSVDAIPTAGFDLNFYRQLVRDGYEGSLQPLRRWTEAPRIYLKTIDEAGAAIDGRSLDTTERAIVETIGLWTGGRLAVAGVERGTDNRVGTAGWITVRWPARVSDRGFCGQSDIAVSGGAIDLFYKQGGNCACPGLSVVRPQTVRHELGHAMGFFHTDDRAGIMSNPATAGCDKLPSARERAAAAIAYARPVGNSDPDTDPASVVTLAPMRAY